MTDTLDRRTFLGVLGTAVGAAAFGPAARARLPGTRTRLRRIGLELYTVREQMKRDPVGTLHQVRVIGYDQVELLWSWNNFGQTTAELKATLEHEGLRAPSAHIAPELLLHDWQRSLDTANSIGQQYLIVPSLPEETDHSLDAWKRWADHFNVAGAAARRAGLWLAFHNEPNHMTPIDGQIPYDVFIARTDPKAVRLQLDTGNMIMGGGDPLAYLHQYVDRFWSFHIKDVVADRSHDTELGRGTVNVRAFLAAIPEIHRKPCYVEQETSADPLTSARIDYNYLKNLSF